VCSNLQILKKSYGHNEMFVCAHARTFGELRPNLRTIASTRTND